MRNFRWIATCCPWGVLEWSHAHGSADLARLPDLDRREASGPRQSALGWRVSQKKRYVVLGNEKPSDVELLLLLVALIQLQLDLTQWISSFHA